MRTIGLEKQDTSIHVAPLFIVAPYLPDGKAKLPNGKGFAQETVEPELELSLLLLVNFK